MDKNSLTIILNECFEKEGNCAYLHFVDGSNLLINVLPTFFNTHFSVVNEYEINANKCREVVCIPYASVIYITLTHADNLKVIYEQYDFVNQNVIMDEDE